MVLNASWIKKIYFLNSWFCIWSFFESMFLLPSDSCQLWPALTIDIMVIAYKNSTLYLVNQLSSFQCQLSILDNNLQHFLWSSFYFRPEKTQWCCLFMWYFFHWKMIMGDLKNHLTNFHHCYIMIYLDAVQAITKLSQRELFIFAHRQKDWWT